jgi:hypothetical protein
MGKKGYYPLDAQKNGHAMFLHCMSKGLVNLPVANSTQFLSPKG